MSAREFKKCGCGARYTVESWKRLPFEQIREDGDGGFIEFRCCGCGSSLAVEVRVECTYPDAG